jgi:hypothetical protein
MLNINKKLRNMCKKIEQYVNLVAVYNSEYDQINTRAISEHPAFRRCGTGPFEGSALFKKHEVQCGQIRGIQWG